MIPEPWAQRGDLVEAGKWLKKLGCVKMQRDEKPRNAFALVEKGKFILAQIVDKKEAETVVNYAGKLQGFKKIGIKSLVKFDVDKIAVFSKEFWRKATKKNLFLGMLDKEKENGLDTETFK